MTAPRFPYVSFAIALATIGPGPLMTNLISPLVGLICGVIGAVYLFVIMWKKVC